MIAAPGLPGTSEPTKNGEKQRRVEGYWDDVEKYVKEKWEVDVDDHSDIFVSKNSGDETLEKYMREESKKHILYKDGSAEQNSSFKACKTLDWWKGSIEQSVHDKKVVFGGPYLAGSKEYDQVKLIVEGKTEGLRWIHLLCRETHHNHASHLSNVMSGKGETNNCFVFIAHAPGPSADDCRYVLSLLVAEKKNPSIVYGHLLCSGVPGVGKEMMQYAAKKIHEDPNILTIRFTPSDKAVPLYKRFGAVDDADEDEGHMVIKMKEVADKEIYSIVLQCIVALRYMRAKGMKHGNLSAREVLYFKWNEALNLKPFYLNLKTEHVQQESSQYAIQLKGIVKIDGNNFFVKGNNDYEDSLSLFSSLYEFPIVREIVHYMIEEDFKGESQEILNHEVTLMLRGEDRDLDFSAENLTELLEKGLYRYCAKELAVKELDKLQSVQEVHDELMLRLHIITYQVDPDAHNEIWESEKMIDHLTLLLKENREKMLKSLMEVDEMCMSRVLLEEIVGKDWRTRVTQDQDISTFEKIQILLREHWKETFEPFDSVEEILSREGLEGFKVFFTGQNLRTWIDPSGV